MESMYPWRHNGEETPSPNAADWVIIVIFFLFLFIVTCDILGF